MSDLATINLLTTLISRIDPTAIYYATDLDEAGSTKYYGFMTKDGYWYIMQVTATAIRYYTDGGNVAYTTNWSNRATLTYNYPNLIQIK